MRVVRNSSLEEYALWYLRRDAAKRDTGLAPEDLVGAAQVMRDKHNGKMRDWFDDQTKWFIAEIEVIDELDRLIFLESSWTKQEKLVTPDGPNYRLLRRVAQNAIDNDYLSNLGSDQRHKRYYERLKTASLELKDAERIAICSAEVGEIRSNPAAKYYLLDGVGRCLPYMMLVMQGHPMPSKIEAFVAER